MTNNPVFQNPSRTVIQSLLQQTKTIRRLGGDLVIQTLILITALILISCTPYTDPSPTTKRAIYPTECDYSPIEFGTIHIYDTDSTYISSIEIDHQYVPLGAYRINLENGTYLFKLHSAYTNLTAYFKIFIHMKIVNIDLNICEGD